MTRAYARQLTREGFVVTRAEPIHPRAVLTHAEFEQLSREWVPGHTGGIPADDNDSGAWVLFWIAVFGLTAVFWTSVGVLIGRALWG